MVPSALVKQSSRIRDSRFVDWLLDEALEREWRRGRI